MTARERFFQKVQQNDRRVPSASRSAEAEIQSFRWRMEELAEQVSQWFAGSGIAVTISTKQIHDLSAIGYSLHSGICRYDITTIRLQNGERSVNIAPEQLCRNGELGCVTLSVGAPGGQRFHLSMAPESGWFIRREEQPSADNVIMTEDLFFRAIDKLA